MFETFETAKQDIPAGFGDPGEYLWDYVYTRLNLHWFHVAAKTREDEEGYHAIRIFFLSHIDDLRSLLNSSDWDITEVSLVSPAHMNGANHWKMELLSEVLVGRESKMEHEQYGLVFVLANENRYVSSFSNQESDLKDLKSVYHS